MASDQHDSAAANAPVPLTRDGWSFAARIFAAQMLLVIVVIVWLGIASYQHVARVALDVRQSTVATVSTTLANDPFVANSLQEDDPSASLQPYTQDILSHAQTIDFITIMTPDLLRVTHPNPAQLGKPYSGSTAEALSGEVFSEQAVGTLGRSVRTIAPVYAKDGKIVGMVATGITLESLQVLYREELP